MSHGTQSVQGNQVAARRGAEAAIEDAASRQYRAAYNFVRRGSHDVPAPGTPAYVCVLVVSALRKAAALRAQGQSIEADRFREAAARWRAALDYPMILQVVGQAVPEYSDAPADESLHTARQIVGVPPVEVPAYQVLSLESITPGTRVVGLFDARGAR